MIARIALAASLASLSLLAPSRTSAWGGAPTVYVGVQVPVAPPPAFVPPPVPPPAFVPPARLPPPVVPRAVRAACLARFGPAPRRVSRCESRWLALRQVPGPCWTAAAWRGDGHDHGHHDD